MELSPGAQELRNLANKLEQISEYNTHSDTGEPDHDISTGDLLRLKVALRPLVDGKTASRFMQILNKMADQQPVSTAEAKTITSAFTSMIDIIASDNGLMNRLKNDIAKFNSDNEKELDNDPDETDDRYVGFDIDDEAPKTVKDPFELK